MFAANPHPTSSKRREVLGWGDNPSHLLAAKVEMDVVGGKCERHQSGKSNILIRACDSISILSLLKICVRLIGSRTVVTATFSELQNCVSPPKVAGKLVRSIDLTIAPLFSFNLNRRRMSIVSLKFGKVSTEEFPLSLSVSFLANCEANLSWSISQWQQL